MYQVKKIALWNLKGLHQVNTILSLCGRDMAKKYDLHHWDNSYIKNVVILILCVLKNQIFLVYDEQYPVATFQLSESVNELKFQKFATEPQKSGGDWDFLYEVYRNDCERTRPFPSDLRGV